MKQILIGIFAHPDDESFGPCGTLLRLVDEGTELHLILVTNGEGGVNTDQHEDLGAVRLKEWQAAGEAIGAKSMTSLGYRDGGLSHSMYEEIGGKLRTVLRDILAQQPEPVELSFITLDQNGLTGHLDHIAVSYLTTQLFCTLKHKPPRDVTIKELAYYCLSRDMAPERDWLHYYTPIGRDDTFVTRRVDIREYVSRKHKIMELHHTQRADAAVMKKMTDEIKPTDHFHVIY